MNSEKFSISYAAATQMALLASAEKEELKRLFASDELHKPATTRTIGGNRFVSRLGRKRVLWQRTDQRKPEIISIVDQSFAQA